MDRRLAANDETVRFRIDATRCDGQGVCALIAPELFALDRYGLAYVTPDGDARAAGDPEVRARGLEADALCPRNAIREERTSARAATPDDDPPTGPTRPFHGRLMRHAAEVETSAQWRAAGGWAPYEESELHDLVSSARLVGHGGAGFPVAEKWRRVAGAQQPVVVMNGSEREPGTEKDRYLLTQRPYLVLDGLRLAMRAVGAQTAYLCIDEGADLALATMTQAVRSGQATGLLPGLEFHFRAVPTRYVAGEETALLSVIEGGEPLPRMRPPYPSDAGVFGRPTLIHNVETLAGIAVAAALGADAYRSLGTTGNPGTGLFTVGAFGGPFSVVEAEYGRRLDDVLHECGMLDSAYAALVGGYSGGLIRRDDFDVPLTAPALRAVGAALGTKSVQILTSRDCPVAVVATIVRYFGAESAGQCPPCARGLPDMAAILDDLEGGRASAESLTTLEGFMGTLSGRGVCRLPDGAARVALSMLTNFADTVAAHLSGACPARRTAVDERDAEPSGLR